MNCTRVFFCNLFNIHTTLFAVNYAKSLIFAVMQESQVVLQINVNSFMHKHRSNWQSRSGSLLRNQIVADHSCSFLFYYLWSLYNVHAALHSGSQMTFASTTSLNLSLDNESSFIAESFCDLKCLFWCSC